MRLRTSYRDATWYGFARRRFASYARVLKSLGGDEAAFEQVWLSRDSHLDKVPGFVEFHLLKGPEAEDHTLYASHTVWENRAVFEAWTKSEAFRAAHSRAGDNKPLYLDHPQFEGFEVRQTIGRGKTAV
jgi:heme-degrading monooxygenase HmoA